MTDPIQFTRAIGVTTARVFYVLKQKLNSFYKGKYQNSGSQ